MKKLRFALVGVIAAAFSVLGLSAPASAYPDVSVSVSVDVVEGGKNIAISATVNPGDVNCDWTLTFLGQSTSSSGGSVAGTFKTPKVDKRTEVEATATCTYDDAALQSLDQVRGLENVAGFEPTIVTVALQTVSGSATQVLLPTGDSDDGDDDGDDSDDDGDDDNGGLPDTGGERLLWLLIGLLLVAGGATVIVTSRRDRDPEAQI